MDVNDILKLPWDSLPYEAWAGLRTVEDVIGSGSTLYFEDLRNFIHKIIQNLSYFLDVPATELEELFWEKNNSLANIRETNSFYYSRSSSPEPFRYPLSCLIFPKPHEEEQIATCKRLFRSLSPVGQAIFLRDTNNQRHENR